LRLHYLNILFIFLSFTISRKIKSLYNIMEGGKRKLNAYMKFVKAKRADVVKKFPKAPVTEIAKKLGAMWRAMSDAEKAKFK
jgi:hypothetical protein